MNSGGGGRVIQVMMSSENIVYASISSRRVHALVT